MPRLNVRQRQPVAALWYSILGGLALSVFILLFTGFFALGMQGACEGGSCGFLNPVSFVPIMSIVVLIILAYPILYWYLFTYELTDRTITVNSGILFRQYETIDFGRVQTIDNERGPLLMLFGLTMVKVWTASADQISFTVGAHSAQAHPQPDTMLILGKGDAQILKDFIIRSKTSSSGM